MKIITSAEAKAQGLKRYFTGNPCNHGHIAERFVSSRECIGCAKEKNAAQYAKNPEKRREIARIYAAENPEKVKASCAKWHAENPEYSAKKNAEYYSANRDKEKARTAAYRAENPEKHKALTTAWRDANPERYAAMKKVYRENNPEKVQEYRKSQYVKMRDIELARMKEWRKSNPHLVNAATARRNAAKLNATPEWANKEKMEEMYKESARITIETGIVHHVDHIVPLQSKHVCGLHCEFNLQVMTGSENQSKSNRHWPDMP